MTVKFDEPVLFAKPIGEVLWVDGYPEGDMAGTWTCRDHAGAVRTCDADGANVVSATFVPKHGFIKGYGYGLGQRAPEWERSGVYDLSGNPSGFINTGFNVS